jgi:hypothetical protein
VENLDTEKKMALRRSLEKYGPPEAMSRVKTTRWLVSEAGLAVFQSRTHEVDR